MQPVAAIVPTYKPDATLTLLLQSLAPQVELIIIVDNTEAAACPRHLSEAIDASDQTLEVIRFGKNLGIATALNAGFMRAKSHGFSLAIPVDQDCVPYPQMVDKLVASYNSICSANRIAIVAPDIRSPAARIGGKYLRATGPFLFERRACDASTIRQVSIVNTSGALHNISAFNTLGPFREDLFIDYVDTDYCLRASAAGYEIVVACNARMLHDWGNRRRRRLGPISVAPTFHPPFRWYYISRNRIATIRVYGLRFPHWLLFDLMLAAWWIVRMLLFEDQRLRKVKAFVLGTWDGIRSRMGPCRRDI